MLYLLEQIHTSDGGEMKKLNNSSKLMMIKGVHTAIWCVFVVAILHILYAGIFDRVNILVWISIGLVFIECIVYWFGLA